MAHSSPDRENSTSDLTLERVRAEEAGERVDVFVCSARGLFRRSQIQSRQARFLINGVESKASTRVQENDTVRVIYQAPPPMQAVPEDVPLHIIYEDADMVVLDKAQGMVVHPAAGNYSGTLVHAILHHFEGLRHSFSRDDLRPGIVHRLDKETSGIIVVAKHPEALAALSDQFAARSVRKTYLALVRGVPSPRAGRITEAIGRDPRNRKRFACVPNGKPADTFYRVVRSADEWSLVELRPRTGRTHQLRVHMKQLGHPILGDDLYHPRDRSGVPGLMLHAYSLCIRPPSAGAARCVHTSVPARFRAVLHSLL